METEMIAIDVFEMTSHGLQKIVRMDLEEPSSDKEKCSGLLSELTEKAYRMDKMFIVTEEFGFSIQDLNKKTIIFKGIFEIVEK